jgi:hypothetical protein
MRSTRALGLVIAGLGLWGALAPFVGPYFAFGFAPDTAWHVTADRVWLSAVPGVVAVIGGTMLFAAHRRQTGLAGGALALAAGAWFVVGPAVSLLWRNTTDPFAIGQPLGGPGRAALDLLASFYAVGVLISVAAVVGLAGRAIEVRMAEAEIDPDESRGVARPLKTGELVV